MTDIVTFGEVLAEFMAMELNQSLGEPGQLAGPFPGGAPAIFIDQAAKLGSSAALVSGVGDDAFGRMLVSRLAADGVDVSSITTVADQTTASAFVTYYESGARDFIFNIANSACAYIEPSQFEAPLRECRLLHIVGCSLFSEHMIDLARHAVARVKAEGGQVSFDPNMRKEILARPGVRDALEALLSATDILLPSDDELNMLVDRESEAEAVARAFELGVSEIVLKRGADGCRYFDSQGSREMAGFKVDEVDPTGAGDSFGATFCTLRAQGMAADQALVYANASGASAVSRRGAMEGTSTRA
ncbi:MAG: sugar kinase, partial [Salinisphaera sp.]|nr:sugar kinase [Salinisphaera sp.]